MSIWGIAEPQAVAAIVTAGGDVAVSAGTETNVLSSSTLTAPTLGNWYPYIDATLAILLGATPPTALVAAVRIGAAADFDTYTVAPATLTANATLVIGVSFVGVNSRSQWTPGGGGVINLTLLATAQAVTLKAVGSRAIMQLQVGLDL